MATINGWNFVHRSTIEIFISENGKNVIAKGNEGIILEIAFLETGFRIISTTAEITVNEQSKTMTLK